MQPLRAYLLIFSESGCESSVHRDLQSLQNAWEIYSGRNDITGVIHVGFGRPETDSFAKCVNNFQGRMLLSASAKWALNSNCLCAPMIVGEAENIPLYIALNGWGYEASVEELSHYYQNTNDLANDIALESVVMTQTDFVSSSGERAQVKTMLLCSINDLELSEHSLNFLKRKNIRFIGDLIQNTENDLLKIINSDQVVLNEIKFALAKKGLSLNRRLENWQSELPGLENKIYSLSSPTFSSNENESDSISIIRFAPPWLLSISLVNLSLKVRTFNALNNRGFSNVGDIANLKNDELMSIPNFGRTSLIDLEQQLKLAIERGPVLIDTNRPLTNTEENSSLSGSFGITTKLSSQFGHLNSLTSLIVGAVASLPTNIEKIVRSRMGLGCEPMTLQEIGDDMEVKVTRERVRQLEAKGVKQLGADPIWKDTLELKLAKLLDERDDPLPFYGLPILDEWFCGIEQMKEPFNYLLKEKDILDNQFSLLQANGQFFVSRLSQDQWDITVKQAMKLLEDGVDHKWGLSEARRHVEDMLGKKGGELRSELWTAAKQFAHFSSPHPDSEPVLVSYGRGAEAMVEAVLLESERPLHYSEIPKIVIERFGKPIDIRRAHNAASSIAFLYGRGVYGVIKHCPLNYQERELIRDEVLEIIFNGAYDRQWSCAELVDILNERGLDFDGKLNAYTLSISLKDSSEIKYLGRNIWAQSSGNPSGVANRIDIRQAVTSLLMQAGKPLSNAEIKEKLRKERGINHSFQIHPSGSLISVGIGLWGLVERDLTLNKNEQIKLVEAIQKILLDRNKGIHISEIVTFLEDHFNHALVVNDPEILFAVAQRSDFISKSHGDYLYLSEWGEPRCLNKSQAIIEALKRANATGLSTGEIIKFASEILERPVERDSIYSALAAAGARINESTKRWVFSETNDIEDE